MTGPAPSWSCRRSAGGVRCCATRATSSKSRGRLHLVGMTTTAPATPTRPPPSTASGRAAPSSPSHDRTSPTSSRASVALVLAGHTWRTDPPAAPHRGDRPARRREVPRRLLPARRDAALRQPRARDAVPVRLAAPWKSPSSPCSRRVTATARRRARRRRFDTVRPEVAFGLCFLADRPATRSDVWRIDARPLLARFFGPWARGLGLTAFFFTLSSGQECSRASPMPATCRASSSCPTRPLRACAQAAKDGRDPEHRAARLGQVSSSPSTPVFEAVPTANPAPARRQAHRGRERAAKADDFVSKLSSNRRSGSSKVVALYEPAPVHRLRRVGRVYLNLAVARFRLGQDEEVRRCSPGRAARSRAQARAEQYRRSSSRLREHREEGQGGPARGRSRGHHRARRHRRARRRGSARRR